MKIHPPLPSLRYLLHLSVTSPAESTLCTTSDGFKGLSGGIFSDKNDLIFLKPFELTKDTLWFTGDCRDHKK